MILISNVFCHIIKMYNIDPYNVLLAISAHIPVLLMTAFVLRGHMCVRACVDPFTLNSLQMEILEGLVVVDVVSGL